MDLDFGGGVALSHLARESRHGLQLGQCPPFGIVAERSYRALHLINDIGVAPVGMESKVARAGARRYFGPWRIVGSQSASWRIEPIDKKLVESQIGGHGKAIGRIEVDGVGMRPFLPVRIDTRTLVLDKRGGWTQPAVVRDRKHRHTAAAVVGNQDVLAGAVHGDVAWSGAFGRLLVHELQFPRSRLDLKRT